MTSIMKTPDTVATPPTVVRSEVDRQKAARERNRNFGGANLKLEVIGEIPGHHLYWANDEAGEIESLLDQGYELVLQSELGESRRKIVADAEVASHVTRHVGVKSDGSPLRAMLMKCSNEIWDEKEDYNRQSANHWDDAIRSGQVEKDSSRYVPKNVTNTLDTKFRKEY